MISSTAAASFAGPVPIGAFDVVPDGATSDAQALIGTQLAVRTVPFTLEDFTTGHTLLGGTADDVAAGTPSGIGRTDNAVNVALDDSSGAPAQANDIPLAGNNTATTTFDDTGFVAHDALAPYPDPIIDTPARTGVAQGLNRAVVPGHPTSVPLPAAVYTGVIGLSTVAWAKRRMKR
jgi:hypothetical protein